MAGSHSHFDNSYELFPVLSSRLMSAFSAYGDFVPRLPAHPLRADAPTDPSFGRLVATTGHQVDFDQRSHLAVKRAQHLRLSLI
jgi:hypothetical protein